MPKNEISRVFRTKEEAKSNYNKISRFYDLITGYWEKKYVETGLEILNVKEGDRVLEIGFGTGNGILNLARSVGKTGKVYGVDISEGMLKITKLKVEKAGLSEKVDLICKDAAKLPFDDKFFNAIFMSFTLELFDMPDIPKLLFGCKRVLRNGGRICVVAISINGYPGLMIRLYEWTHQKFPSYIDCRPIFAQEALEEAGFKIVDMEEMSMFGLPIEIVLGKKIN